MMSQKENFFRFYLTEADPWYTGNFDETYEDVVAGCRGFLYYLQQTGELSADVEITEK